MKTGDQIKVFLPGESPWAEVLEINGPLVKAKIINKLFHEHPLDKQREFTGEHFETAEPLPKLHNFKKGDELWFEAKGPRNTWEPTTVQ
jgi:hypothetical protein